MRIYIDTEYKCRVQDGDGMNAVETAFFDGKCDAYIEGYRFIPEGEIWINEDGTETAGETAVPWKNHRMLDAAQREYERETYENLALSLAEYAGEYAAAYHEGVQSA